MLKSIKKNIPNIITISRLILIIPFCILASNHDTHAQTAALIIFIIASLSDFFDGYYARKLGNITTLGKLLDPVADKLLVFSALICICAWTVNGVPRIPEWSVVVILAREFLITTLRSVLAEKNVILPASKFGKIKTITQLSSIILFLAYFDDLAIWVYYLALIVTVISGIEYLVKTWRYLV